jgi:hypothetical protein
MIHLRRTLTLPLRRWRTYGFGIHSPFAYELMTKVIGERSEYYAYESLRQFHTDRYAELTLLLRLLCHFAPSEVAVAGSSTAIDTVIHAYDSRVDIVPPAPDHRFLIVESANDLSPAATPGTNSVIVVRHINHTPAKHLWRRLRKTYASECMTFNDGRIGIICRRSMIPTQSFKFSI